MHTLLLVTFIGHSLALPSLVIRSDPSRLGKRDTAAAGGAPDIQISRLHVTSDIQLRYARTLVTSYIKNAGEEAGIAEFKALIPDTAFLSNFSMEVKGVEYVAEVQDKKKASQTFAQQVEQGQGAGLVEQDSRDTNIVVIKTNIEPAEKVLFRLTYDELLERTQGSYKQTFMVNPGQIVEDYIIKVNINESLPIALLVAPQLKTSNEIDFSETSTDSSIALISRNVDNDPAKATVEFTISPEYQREQGLEGVQGEFSVLYDVDRTNQTSEVQVVDGYFVHFFAPENLPVMPKHIIFVLDVSGSMQGPKLQQLKDAMFTILDEMTEQDYFDIISFSSSTSRTATTMKATDANKKKGQDLILKLRAGGLTNIDRALKDAVDLGRKMITEETVKGGETMILFLADGDPTAGEENNEIIVSNIEANNGETQIPIYTLAFGQDADFTLMKNIAGTTDARAKRIYEGSDAALQLEGFYQEIASPLLANIKFKYVGESVDQESISSQDKSILFKGTESIVVGKVNSHGESFIAIAEGEGKSGGFQDRIICSGWRFSGICGVPGPFPLPLPLPSPVDAIETPVLSPAQSFIKKLYAFLTIKQALKEDDQQSQDKALKLALENNFVTKLTSLVVTKENKTKETIEPVSLQEPIGFGPIWPPTPLKNGVGGWGWGGAASASAAVGGGWGGFGGASAVAAAAAPITTTPRITTTALTALVYDSCKLALFAKTYKRGLRYEVTDTTADLGNFKDEAVSAEVKGQCCWRVYAEQDFQGENLVLRPAVTYNSVTSLQNLLRNLKSAKRITC